MMIIFGKSDVVNWIEIDRLNVKIKTILLKSVIVCVYLL